MDTIGISQKKYLPYANVFTAMLTFKTPILTSPIRTAIDKLWRKPSYRRKHEAELHVTARCACPQNKKLASLSRNGWSNAVPHRTQMLSANHYLAEYHEGIVWGFNERNWLQIGVFCKTHDMLVSIYRWRKWGRSFVSCQGLQKPRSCGDFLHCVYRIVRSENENRIICLLG